MVRAMAWQFHLGNRVAPVRFIVFMIVLVASLPALIPLLGIRQGVMAAFDAGAAIFLLSTWPLLGCDDPKRMRDYTARNDANRSLLLAITGAVSLVILIAVFSELQEKNARNAAEVTLIIATLALAWLFSNMIYALHYAHQYYVQKDKDGDGKAQEDAGGLDFPATDEPVYWDFVYFAFTLGMTFQTSDTGITHMPMRRVVTVHCLAAFVFNLGVLAFTINTLGGGS